MSYLTWIDDCDLEKIVGDTLTSIEHARRKSECDLGRNVLDPVSALFSGVVFGGNAETWKTRELSRQVDKSLSNAVGTFHQSVLGRVRGWGVPSNKEATFDVINDDTKVIAEIKNKHNTIKASDIVGYYDKLLDCVTNKNSRYVGYTAYLVHIIPKTCGVFPLTTSDNRTKGKRIPHPLVLQIDGKSFYELATGVPSALEDLLTVLPLVIKDISGVCLEPSMEEMVKDIYSGIFSNKPTTKAKKR